MSIFNVKKDGSGTHTQIQAAIYDAVDGDIINIGVGTWYENIELYKSVQLIGSGKDQTFLEGQLANFTFSGGTFYQGEDVITVTSTTNLVKGRRVTSSVSGGFATNCRVSEIINETQFRVSPATVAPTGNYLKTAASVTAGVNTIVLPNTTSVTVGTKVVGNGVSGIITAINTTTKTITLNSNNTISGTNVALIFRLARTNATVTMPSTFTGSLGAATIQLMNIATNGIVIKDMCITGFDSNTPAVEAASIYLTSPASGSHQNWLIDGCKIVAAGESAITSSSNFNSQNGTVQNCVFDGQTFIGSEPVEVPGFSTATMGNLIVTAVTGTGFTIEFPSTAQTPTAGGSSFTSPSYVGTASFASSNPSLKQATFNKASSGLIIGQVISMGFNMQTCIPNVARQMIVIGNSSTVSSCINTTFKNNTINGKTGAVISATGNRSMFNTAVGIDTVGGLIENNVVNGYFGAGGSNPLVANFAIRSRRPEGAALETIIRNNTNIITGGRGNSGFYLPGSPVTVSNNVDVNSALVNPVQPVAGQSFDVTMDKEALKGVSKVALSPVYSDESNWDMVTYVYKQVGGSKRLTCSFKDPAAEIKMKLKYGVLSGMQFQLHKVIIAKSDRSLLVIKRSEIEGAASMDITLA